MAVDTQPVTPSPRSLIGSNSNTQTFHSKEQDYIRFGSLRFYYFDNLKITKRKTLAPHKVLFANADFNEDMGYDSAEILVTLFFYNNINPQSWDEVSALRSRFLNDPTAYSLFLPTGEFFNVKMHSISEVIDVKHLDGFKVEVVFIEELTNSSLNGIQELGTTNIVGNLSQITSFIPGPVKDLQNTVSIIDQFNSRITSFQQYVGQANLLVQRGQGYVNSVVGKLNDLLGVLSLLENNVVKNSFYMTKNLIDRLVNQCALSRDQIIAQIRLAQMQNKAPQKTMLTYVVPATTSSSQLSSILGISQDVLRTYNTNLGLVVNPSTIIYYTR